MVSKYLHTLGNLHIIRDELPVTSHPGARGKQYRIIDPYLLFWFRYAYPNRIDLEFSRVDEVQQFIMQSYDHHCGQCFENLVQEFIREKIILPDKSWEPLGRWWVKEKEIDEVGISEKERTILFCEVKWSDLSRSDLIKIRTQLQLKASDVLRHPDDRKEIYCIIGRTIANNPFDSHENINVYDLNSIEKILQRKSIK